MKLTIKLVATKKQLLVSSTGIPAPVEWCSNNNQRTGMCVEQVNKNKKAAPELGAAFFKNQQTKSVLIEYY